MTAVWSVIIVLALAVALLGLLVVSLLRSHAEIIRRLDSLGVRLEEEDHGTELTRVERAQTRDAAKGIAGVTPEGEPVVVSPTVGTDPVLVAFLSTSCSSCTVFWEWIDGARLAVDDLRFRPIVVTLGAEEESPTRAQSLIHGSPDVVMSSEAWADYEVPGAPYFVLVDPGAGNVIGEGTAQSVESLQTFLVDSTGDKQWDEDQRWSDRTHQERERMVDDELRRAGIYPGDPRLYELSEPEEEDD